MVVVHGGQVIAAVGEGGNLLVGEVFAVLLKAAVQVAQVGLDVGDDLAIGANAQAQYPVGAGVLGPHVQDHLFAFHGAEAFGQLISSRHSQPRLSLGTEMPW